MVKTTAVLITHASTALRDHHSQESTLLTKAINCIGGAAGRSAITSLRSAVHGSASVNLSLQTTDAQAPAPRSVVYSGAHQPLALAELTPQTAVNDDQRNNVQTQQQPTETETRFCQEPIRTRTQKKYNNTNPTLPRKVPNRTRNQMSWFLLGSFFH